MIGLPFGGAEHALGVGRDQRAAREDAEVDGLEMAEQGVVALDRHHRLPRLDRVAVVEREDLERVPVVEQSLRTAIASSIPPSIAVWRWNTCITTRGWRPSASSVARVWLKYASV